MAQEAVPIPKGAKIGAVPIPHGASVGEPQPPSTSSLDYAKQLGQGALNLLGGVGASVFEPAATVQRMVTGHVNPTLEELATPPTGTLGTVGKVAGEAAQFMVPGGAEELAAGKIGEALGSAPRIAQEAGKLLPTVASTAAVNTLQGGSPEAGAAAGAAGGVLGRVAEEVAPKIAESALGVSTRGRAFGRTPGVAALEETTGYTPTALSESTATALDRIGGQLSNAYAAAGQSGGTASLKPALKIVQDAWEQAQHERNPRDVAALEELYTTLATPLAGGRGGTELEPEEVWAIKRGLGKNTNWSANVDPKWAQGIRRRVYGALDKELDSVAPEAADLNQKYSSLREVQHRSEIESRGSGLAQRTLERFGRHTGALAGGIGGAYYGGEKEGLPGAIKYGLLGVVGPELVASPTGQMFVARNIKGVRQFPKIALPLVREEFSKK